MDWVLQKGFTVLCEAWFVFSSVFCGSSPLMSQRGTHKSLHHWQWQSLLCSSVDPIPEKKNLSMSVIHSRIEKNVGLVRVLFTFSFISTKHEVHSCCYTTTRLNSSKCVEIYLLFRDKHTVNIMFFLTYIHKRHMRTVFQLIAWSMWKKSLNIVPCNYTQKQTAGN